MIWRCPKAVDFFLGTLTRVPNPVLWLKRGIYLTACCRLKCSQAYSISSGWWYTYPSEKCEFVSWDDYSPYMENHKIHVPNHQPVIFHTASSPYLQSHDPPDWFQSPSQESTEPTCLVALLQKLHVSSVRV